MKIRTVQDYLSKAGIKHDDTFTKDEAESIMNEHVIGVYKGRVSLREDKIFTGYEIADKLQTIESVFAEAVEKAFEEEEEEEIS